MFHRSVQHLDSQSGLVVISRSSRASGMVVGSGSACGYVERNTDIIFLDSASARLFLKLDHAIIKAKYLAKWASWFREDLELIVYTTAVLLHHTKTTCPPR